jgi:hypothetical protein
MFIKSPGFLPLVIRIFNRPIVFVNLGHENIHMAKDQRAWTFGDLFHYNDRVLDLGHEIFTWPRICPSIWEYFP